MKRREVLWAALILLLAALYPDRVQAHAPA